MAEKPSGAAHSVDLDGVLYRRPPMQLNAMLRLLAVDGAKKLFAAPTLPKMVDRVTQENGRIGVKNSTLYLSHIFRGLTSGALDFIERAHEQSDVFINTGRPAYKYMVDLTKKRLKRGGILEHIQGIYFKPTNKEINSMISKGVALRELSEKYEEVTHTDDDISTVIPLAKIFNRITFNVIRDWTTGLLENELKLLGESLPNNIRIYQSLKEVPVKSRLLE